MKGELCWREGPGHCGGGCATSFGSDLAGQEVDQLSAIGGEVDISFKNGKMALDQTQEWPVFFLGIIMVIMFLFHLSAFGIPTLGQVLSLGRTLHGVSELL